MTTADDLFDQSTGDVQRLGLNEIPFTESSADLESETLRRVFTGRENELRQVFRLFQGRERRRILVSGRLGIGKSAFLLEVLSVLRRKRPKMLTTYISLPANLDIATTALIAIAREMPDNPWAQRQLHQMGIPTDKPVQNRTTEGGVKTLITASVKQENAPTTELQYPTVALDTLLEQAQKEYPDGVVIAIDDLDKQNPSRVRQLMHDAQGVLKGRAWFMLTGHPFSMTSDLLTSERGLFDLQLPLTELDEETTYRMLINYLNSARINEGCTDPADPACVLPFTPDAAYKFCKVSLGRPRLFNRLGNTVLSTAADLQAETIDLDVLNQGLRAAEPTLIQRAQLTIQEERVRTLLLNQGELSDADITYEELDQLGVNSFSDLLPILERLEAADLAYRSPQDDADVFRPTLLPPADTEE
ncbi:MAG: AAA family ATPase [Spirulina sp. SIO3F2]|nr:AAA family ATPase [Spirulina sp. SIO3F2]